MTSGNNKRFGRQVRLGTAAASTLDPVLRRQGKLFRHIVAEWAYIAGEARDWAVPMALHFTGDRGQAGRLSIAATSARAPELQMLAPLIVDRTNKVLGYRAIEHIRIDHHAPPPEGQTDSKNSMDG